MTLLFVLQIMREHKSLYDQSYELQSALRVRHGVMVDEVIFKIADI